MTIFLKNAFCTWGILKVVTNFGKVLKLLFVLCDSEEMNCTCIAFLRVVSICLMKQWFFH